MKEHDDPNRLGAVGAPGAEVWTSAVIGEAGRRPALPAADLAIITAAAHREWQKGLVRRTEPAKGRNGRVWLIAASLVVTVLAAWWWRRTAIVPGAEMVATVAVAGDLDAAYPVGSELSVGSRVVNRAPLALRLNGGESLRLAADSAIEMLSSSHVRLDQGAMYVDSGPSVRGKGVAIETNYGWIREIGTQFEVHLGEAGEALRVRVREGEVEIRTRDVSRSAVAGQEVAIRADGSVRQGEVELFGVPWAWAEAVAPGFVVDGGGSLADYLMWIERELGLGVEFADPELVGDVEGIILYGSSIETLAPRESLEVVLASSGLSYRVEGGILLIFSE